MAGGDEKRKIKGAEIIMPVYKMHRQASKLQLAIYSHLIILYGKLNGNEGIVCHCRHPLCFQTLRLQHNRELALFLCLPVTGRTTALFEGRFGTKSV